jgi:sodium/hydrogen antiporter
VTDPYVFVLAGVGVVVLLTAWLPMVVKELPMSLPILCVALGAGLFGVFDIGPAPSPLEHLELSERLTELVVIVALMGAGLKLDAPLRRATAGPVLRVLLIGMPLTILAIGALSVGLLGVGLAAALLLGAALAPTDPVLASDVQVGAPGEGGEDEVRLTLTAEAGFNDGLAFPFVHLAIALALVVPGGEVPVSHWLAVDVVWKLLGGGAIGFAVGRLLGWLTFRLPNRARLSRTGDGFVALGITALAYSAAELAHAYGFVAVFVAALAFRGTERRHRYHEKLHEFTEQIERLLLMLLLVLFGGALAAGGLLRDLDWPTVAFALATIFVVRPLAGWLSLVGSRIGGSERAVIAFFGIRGVGTIYYLSFAATRAPVEEMPLLWSAASLVILLSIVMHGTTVTPTMRWIDRRRERLASSRSTAAPP